MKRDGLKLDTLMSVEMKRKEKAKKYISRPKQTKKKYNPRESSLRIQITSRRPNGTHLKVQRLVPLASKSHSCRFVSAMELILLPGRIKF